MSLQQRSTTVVSARSASKPAVERPRVVHILDRLSIGGMETVLLDVIAATRDRYSHHVIGLYERGERAAQAQSLGATVESIDKRAGKDIAAYGRLWRRLWALAPAIVHTYNVGAVDACLPARLAGVRRVVHAEHGRDAADPHGANRKYRWLRWALAPAISRFVPVSNDLAGWLARDVGISPRRITTIGNGVTTARFQPRETAGPSNDTPGRVTLIGSVGRLDTVKGFDTLIAAFAELCERLPTHGLRLEIVGDGPQRDRLARCIDARGLGDRAVLAGARSDVAAFLSTVDIYVCSSIAEGIALTVIEAMAAGCPVVATRVGGNPELIRAGRDGALVAPNDPVALADALAGYVTHPDAAAAAGQAAQARAVAEFDVAIMADRYRVLYDDLLGSKSSASATRKD